METEMGVVIYMHLKHSPDYIDSIYIYIYGFMGLIHKVQVFLLNTILGIFSFTQERKKCGQVGSSPCYSQSEVVYAYQVLDL